MENKILEILAEICGEEAREITPELDLYEIGFLDSFGTLRLLLLLSDEFNVDLDASDITREQIASVEKIIKTLSQKKGLA